MAYQVQKLSRFVAQNAALADLPFGIVKGLPITPRQALEMLRRNESVTEIIQAMATAGMDPPQEDWRLTEAYYESLLRLPGPKPKIYSLGQPEMTLEEALMHVRLRDEKGQELLKSYQGMLNEMARRMK